jgi:branched-subunit amino acid transport protein
MTTWMTIVAMALVTYASRSMPLLTHWKAPHPFIERTLRYVPPAVLAALATPALLAPGSSLEVGPRLWAGLLGAAIPWRTESLPLTISAGLVTFALLH